MTSFMEEFFGPLPREYCAYFYVLAIVSAVMFVLCLVTILTVAIKNFKKVNSMFVANSTFLLLNTFISYIANRLFYTMCVKSI